MLDHLSLWVAMSFGNFVYYVLFRNNVEKVFEISFFQGVAIALCYFFI